MTAPAVSAVLCTHNPRVEPLRQTLASLECQTLPRSDWELLLVDNASRPGSILPEWVSWHPGGRVVREEQLGLTHARVRGIAEARGTLLVFVDDDNVLDATYLEAARRIAADYPFIGAFGGGISGRFEQAPPAWALGYLDYLAVREVRCSTWSNATTRNPACPRGAGLCIRRPLAVAYVEALRRDPIRASLDRIGASLGSCGDTDLAFTACDQGLGTGLFPELQLQHLIPAERLKLDYLCRLVRSTHASLVILEAVRGGPRQRPGRSRLGRIFKAYQRFRLPREIRLLDRAIESGMADGYAVVERLVGPSS